MLRSVRLGSATNSSSTHSIILHSAANKGTQNVPMDAWDIEDDGTEYMNNSYCLRDPADKLTHILIQHAGNLGPLYYADQERLSAILKRHGLTKSFAEYAEAAEKKKILDSEIKGYCDMDGLFSGDDALTWLDFMLSPEVAIHGWYDNYDNPHFSIEDDHLAIDLMESSVRWKVDGPALVGHDTHTGNKIRWSPEPYEKSSAPELVDLKITQFCGYGCDFCYQGSTKEGQHAPLERIKAILGELAAMQVFEVAIGGGEPCHHPDFAEIARHALKLGINFNFTAYGLDWIKNQDLKAVFEDKTLWPRFGRATAVGVGLSIHNEKDVMKAVRAKEALRMEWGSPAMHRINLIAQTVIGVTSHTNMLGTLYACADAGVPLLLLGYKPVGRGADYTPAPKNIGDVRDLLIHARNLVQDDDLYRNFHLSVDTAFLDSYGELLNALEVPHILRTSPEGAFSMYIDAVEDTVAPSSYCGADQVLPRGNIKDQFAGF